jgi:hypothetical protein
VAARRILLIVAAMLFLAPGILHADALNFTFSGGLVVISTGLVATPGAGVISNAPANSIPGGQLAVPSNLTSIFTLPAGLTSFSGTSLGSVIFTTGTVIQGSKASGQYTFNPGGGISVTANALGLGGVVAPNATLFSGVFSGITSFTNPTTPIGPWTLTGKITTTSLNAALLQALGIPSQPTGNFVALEIDVAFRLQGGAIQSGTITLVPEPGTLVLAGTGLIGLAGVLRRRLKKS